MSFSVGGLRLRFEDMFIVVSPQDNKPFLVEITDVGGHPVSHENRRRGLQHLLETTSSLRKQVYAMLGGKIG